MKLMNERMNSKHHLSRLFGLVAASGLAMSGSAALAQSGGGSGYDDHMEYEPGEGLHEEEWYDPTDWWDDDFDGVRGRDVDYEYDDNWNEDWHNGFGDDDDRPAYTTAFYDGDAYDRAWWDESETELYNDGYYSGYYDGYQDDSFGYDHQSAVGNDNNSFSSGYSAGYYDGFYDKERGYQSDWTYYIYMTPVDDKRADASRERGKDRTRDRGDRASEAGTDTLDRRQASQDARNRDMTRTRGTVTKVQTLKDSKLSSGMKGHRVVRLTFEDGRTVVADLGKKSRSGMIEKGDRVTVCGDRVTRDGRKMLDVSRLSVNDEVMWNSQHEDQPQQVSSR